MCNLSGTTVILDTLGIKPNYSELGRIHRMDRRTAKKRHLGIENKKRGRNSISCLDQYKELIKEKLDMPGTTKKGVYQYIIMNVNDDIGTYSNFSKYLNKNIDYFKDNSNMGKPRFETEMGKQLQFDWKGPITLINKNNEEIQFYIFSATLCASRLHKYVYGKYMTLESVERCLIEVFKYIGGVPEECLTDNMSSIVNYSQHAFTKEFKQFAKDMGFNPKKCGVGKPYTKGKDESCNRFVNWLIPYNREFTTEEELIEIINKITQEVNKQINQTTNMPPIAIFEQEKEYLQPLPSNDILDKYLDTMIPVKVANTLLVHYKGAEYSVPAKFIGKTVKLDVNNNKLYIYYNKDLIATHDLSEKKFNYNENHYIEALSKNESFKSQKQIEELAKHNLELLDKIKK